MLRHGKNQIWENHRFKESFVKRELRLLQCAIGVRKGKKMKLIRIIGNIGSGKSTLLEKLLKTVANGIQCIYEPVEENPLLPLFYARPDEFSFPMQTFMQNYFYMQTERLVSQDVKRAITDYGLTEVFSGVLRDQEFLSGQQFRSIMDMTEKLQSKNMETLYIYLDIKPSICLERIRSRARPCELVITLEYLSNLKAAYDAFDCGSSYMLIVLEPEKYLDCIRETISNFWEA